MHGACLLDQRVAVVAKRNHCCSFCGGGISPGELYDFWSYKLKTGEFVKVKACCVCDRFADDFFRRMTRPSCLTAECQTLKKPTWTGCLSSLEW